MKMYLISNFQWYRSYSAWKYNNVTRFYRIYKNADCWYKTGMQTEKPLQTTLRHIKKHYAKA